MTTEEITTKNDEIENNEETHDKTVEVSEAPTKNLPQSGFGIASLVLSILLLIFWLYFILSSVIIAQTGTYGEEGFSMLQVMKGFSLKGFFTANLGIVFAVAGLLSKNRNKTSVFWGLGINWILSMIFLYIAVTAYQIY